jgi:hypothetical protein
VRTVAQVFGGVAVFRIIQVLWALEISETHVGRSHSAVYNVSLKTVQSTTLSLQVCSADLTVPVLHGAIIEGVCTLVCRSPPSPPATRPPGSAPASSP